MKYRHIIFALIGTIVSFAIWSMADMTCKPCIIPPDAPENYVCTSICKLEPRWVDWFRSFTNAF
ncbi:hypothetical protein [Nitrosopumilus sp.]|uniref:hypothetical protein n=1 Tax=Nitrosopumilus sp. TaxID=2024843 RepID=UPI00247D6927|nr:hypothetical protein [Nitrosopumilus sp.]MCV0410159.1 hypothetical protein [Nitrosopumilus sp.]